MLFAQLYAIIIAILGALTLGFAVGRAYQHSKEPPMANSSDQLLAAAADAAVATKALTDQVATLQTNLDSTKVQLAAAQADLAADEEAIAAVIPTLPKSAPAA